MLLDPYPLSGFDDIDFDDAGIGPISLGGHLDELEMSRRRGSPTTTSTTTPVDDSESAFSGALETNVTASLGQTAFLRCRLKNSQHQVSIVAFSPSQTLPLAPPFDIHSSPVYRSRFICCIDPLNQLALLVIGRLVDHSLVGLVQSFSKAAQTFARLF